MPKPFRYNSPGWRSVIEARRSQVAQLLVRHMTRREIVEALAKLGSCNPDTGEPWALKTVHQDCVWVETRWREQAEGDIRRAKGLVLAQIRAVQRQAWLDRNYRLLLDALKQERELLGLDAPAKVDVTLRIRELAEEMGLDPDEAVLEAERLLRRPAGR